MTFGQAVRQVLRIYDIKMGALADALGYDISYLSKWVNDTKLPSPRSAESLCSRIAAYVTASGTPAMDAEAAARLGIFPSEGVPFQKALADCLYAGYQRQKTGPEPAQAASGAQLAGAWCLNPDDAVSALLACYADSPEDTAGLMALPQELLRSDFLLQANGRCPADPDRALRLKQLISVADFDGDVNRYIRYILRHISLLSPIQVEYYAPFQENERPSAHPLFLLKNQVAAVSVSTPPGSVGTISVLTREPGPVARLYDSCQPCFNPVLLQVERLDLYNDLPYSFAVGQNSHALMPYMGNVRLGPDLVDEFLDKYLDAPAMYDYHRKMHMLTCFSSYSLTIYVSALIDYINTGRIHLFDGVITVEKEDRRRHLQFLLGEIEENKGLKVQILNDKNPILNREDNILTLYTSEDVSFAVSDAPGRRSDIFNFLSPVIQRQVKTFFDHIETLPGCYLRSGKDAADFISGMIRMI